MTKCKSVSNDKKYGNLERILTSFQCESYPIQVMFQHLFNSFMSLSKVLQYFSEIFFIFLLNLFLCRSIIQPSSVPSDLNCAVWLSQNPQCFNNSTFFSWLFIVQTQSILEKNKSPLQLSRVVMRHSSFFQDSSYNTVVCRLTMGIHPEKCIVR